MTDLNKEREAFERFHAKECNCSYEDLKRQLDRQEALTGHRYLPTSPRHEAWLIWDAAWNDASAQAVPEGYVVVPKVPTEKFKEDLKQHLDELWWGDHGCDWDGFVSVNGIDPLKIYALAIEASESGAEG
ncbi:Uncharacterised protein [Acinetobacter baumannii]|uniref:hypothetical protein n=1 Tax=Acinetobacter baumannii TaxID=470 RepID=UPI0002B943BA|nr:hypothetical protein [Acinetobacter baumannii]AOP63036.1 hypothetical protein DU202_01871 [Acinetobacter baumannii DU202]EKV0751338.1 hypothetical protein [Acinetobacter baumannii]EKX7521092.1 hypothetical protein [Acinetobacter baumannii]EKX9627916.1 hypothetical protein [Acinetobacter baumannii]EKX9885283.1 hypothetical protein [Acinetobacter baumannii]